MHEDFERCYRAVASRDARFDGRFVTAVRTTGIYCRPSCPAQTPHRRNVRFYPCAAAAVAAGFRACRRCRPDAAPGSREWDARGDLAARALRAVADGVVDEVGVAGLSRRLAVSPRHLHRVLVAEVGAGPLALARTRRAQAARLLVEQTDLSLTGIAYAAGFASVRQFNDTMRVEFGVAPSQLRGRPVPTLAATGRVSLRLACRPPYDGPALRGWLAARAVPGLETADDRHYRRVLPTAEPSVLEVGLADGDGPVPVRLQLSDAAVLPAVVARCRRLLDLDAEPAAVVATLGADPALAPWLAGRPGLRVPGTVDGFELAVRAVLGQQVSVAAARTLTARLVAAHGQPLPAPQPGLTHRFPTAEALADADLDGAGLPATRARTVRELAARCADGRLDLGPGADREAALAALREVPGVGAWTSAYVALRALADPDAFPAGDLGLRRAAARAGLPGEAGALLRHAERWRPWRGYAAQLLWTLDPTGDDRP